MTMVENDSKPHQPVLLKEVIAGLALKTSGIYIDATFGRGGHSREILSRLDANGRLLVIDKDPEAIAVANRDFGGDKRVFVKQGSFTLLRTLANEYELTGKVNGILLDLGVSSPQLDDAERGFSFLRDGPLDMRMDNTQGLDAKTWINQANAQEIAHVLKEYGEERFAKRIANAIVNARKEQTISTTKQLADIVSQANPAWEKHKHPATRVFQAIRIFINEELNDLKTALLQCLDVLAPEGRLCVISFHSLEDRIVKQFLQKQSKGDDFPIDLPIMHQQLNPTLRVIGKAIKASVEEIRQNPRARSAVLRIGEKIS